jgi:hypothetical protein
MPIDELPSYPISRPCFQHYPGAAARVVLPIRYSEG